MSETKFKKKFNIIDIFIILAAIIIGFIGIKFLRKTEVIAPQTVKVTYTYRSDEEEPEIANMIEENTDIYDSIKNYYMGKVIKKETIPATRDLYDEESKAYKSSVVEGKENMILTIEADAIIQGKDILVDNQYDIKVGNQTFIKGKGFASRGYIIGVERIGD